MIALDASKCAPANALDAAGAEEHPVGGPEPDQPRTRCDEDGGHDHVQPLARIRAAATCVANLHVDLAAKMTENQRTAGRNDKLTASTYPMSEDAWYEPRLMPISQFS